MASASRQLTAAAFALLLSVRVVSGTQQPQGPAFKSSVDLATLDVTVVDKDGHPLAGLRPEDFVVTLNGETRAVRVVDFIQTGAPTSARSESVLPATGSSGTRRPAARTVLILFDDLSYKPGAGRGLIQLGQRLLSSLDADDSIGFTTTSGDGPSLNPTRDHAAVTAALQGRTLAGRDTDTAAPFYVSLNEALEIERAVQPQTLQEVANRECLLVMPVENHKTPSPLAQPEPYVCPNLVEAAAKRLAEVAIARTAKQLAAYRAAITALKPAPAPRVIVALTAGLALSPEHGDLQRQLEPVAHAASDAGVELYALSSVPDDTDPRDLVPERARARRAEGRLLDNGIQALSSAAGGETFLVTGTADRFLGRIVSETSAFYRLGVELPEAHAQPYFSAKVAVARPGAVVLTHTEALGPVVAAAPNAPMFGAAMDEQLRSALDHGSPVPDLPIALTTRVRRDPDPAGHLQLALGVQVPASARAPLTARYALANDKGEIVKQAHLFIPPATAGADYLVTFPIPIDPGDYQLRLAVADAAGTIGLVTEPVTARLARVGAYSASELLKTWTDNAGAAHAVMHDTLPEAAVKFRVALELYPDEAAVRDSGLSVRLSLMPVTAQGEDPPIVTGTFVPTRNGQTLSIAADVPASALAEGTFVIHAVVLQDGQPVGEVSSSIKKTASSGKR